MKNINLCILIFNKGSIVNVSVIITIKLLIEKRMQVYNNNNNFIIIKFCLFIKYKERITHIYFEQIIFKINK